MQSQGFLLICNIYEKISLLRKAEGRRQKVKGRRQKAKGKRNR
jgi:hypothetical protein